MVEEGVAVKQLSIQSTLYRNIGRNGKLYMLDGLSCFLSMSVCIVIL